MAVAFMETSASGTQLAKKRVCLLGQVIGKDVLGVLAATAGCRDALSHVGSSCTTSMAWRRDSSERRKNPSYMGSARTTWEETTDLGVVFAVAMHPTVVQELCAGPSWMGTRRAHIYSCRTYLRRC
jgi:hypothetical protein